MKTVMSDKEKAERIFGIEKLSIEECVEKLDRLNDIEQVDLSEIEKAEYLILKFRVEGKNSFLADSYTCKILQELVISWIEEEKDIPDLFADLFFMTHIDWLIDWNNSSGTHVVVRPEIVDNMHTFINPFLEEIEEILGEPYKSRGTTNLKDRIVTDIESLVNYPDKDKLPEIYNALFKVKYAIQGAREYLMSGKRKSINLNSTKFELDIQSIAHIFLRHTNRFKSLSHRDSSGKRGFMSNELGSEYEEIEKILTAIEVNVTQSSSGVITCQIEGVNYKVVVKTGRIVTLYPID